MFVPNFAYTLFNMKTALIIQKSEITNKLFNTYIFLKKRIYHIFLIQTEGATKRICQKVRHKMKYEVYGAKFLNWKESGYLKCMDDKNSKKNNIYTYKLANRRYTVGEDGRCARRETTSHDTM